MDGEKVVYQRDLRPGARAGSSGSLRIEVVEDEEMTWFYLRLNTVEGATNGSYTLPGIYTEETRRAAELRAIAAADAVKLDY